MKILYLCTFYHKAFIFKDIMNRLKSKNYEIKVFNAVSKNTIIDDKFLPIMDHNVVHKECFNKYDRYIYVIKQLKIYLSVKKSYAIKDFDLIHSHNLFNGGLVAYLLKRKYGIPYVVSVRNTDMNTFLKYSIFKFVANFILKHASGVQFLSRPYYDRFVNDIIKDKYKQELIKKSVIISNGLEDFWLQNKGKPKMLIAEKPIRFICVGKIDQNKNLMTSIKVVEEMIRRGYNANFKVIGKCFDSKVFEELKSKGFVEIYDFASKERLHEYYNDSDIYLMPSIHETFGRVYAEAMSQGLPVLYSKKQGFDGQFSDGTVGFAVNKFNINDISDKIELILKNYEEISRNCIDNSDTFNWDHIAQITDIFYRKSAKGD